MRRRAALAEAALLVATVAVAAASVAAAGAEAGSTAFSKLWGRTGELWKPAGRLPDFSFAGYRQSNVDLPSPPVTRSVLAFRKPGGSDTDMLVAAVDWANRAPLPPGGGYTVLSIPAGTYQLTAPLAISRSRVVLRGAGAGRTILNIPKSLTDLFGKSPDSEGGGYVRYGAFAMVQGNGTAMGTLLTSATGRAAKGQYTVTVADASRLVVSQYYDVWWQDVGGKFLREMFGGFPGIPSQYAGSTRVRFNVKLLAKAGNRVTLERPLPYNIAPGIVNVFFWDPPQTTTEVGIEGLTFRFRWELYAGHHLERGFNAIEVRGARDCWVRDVEAVNADNVVLINDASSAITVTGVRAWYTKTRANNVPNRFNEPANYDGHWGLTYARSFGVLFRNFTLTGNFIHEVGTGSAGKWGVFCDGRMNRGNMDLHRAMAGPTLYTAIDAGRATDALVSGGPESSGPNTLAGSTWWGIGSSQPVDPNDSNGNKPGSCGYGQGINLVGVNLRNAKGMCASWSYERALSGPRNLFQAQLDLRRKAGRAGSA